MPGFTSPSQFGSLNMIYTYNILYKFHTDNSIAMLS